jgi:hypothetical protein
MVQVRTHGGERTAGEFSQAIFAFTGKRAEASSPKDDG